MACGIQFPDQGSLLGYLRWEHRVLGTGPPGKSLHYRLLQAIEWSSLCYAVGPCCLVILYRECVYLNLKAPNLSPNSLFLGGRAVLGFLCFSLVVESGG